MRNTLCKLYQQIPVKSICKLPKFSFTQIEAKKTVDKTKASIRLMIENSQIRYQTDLLKLSHQYGVTQATKAFNIQSNNVSLGEIATLIYQSQMIPLQLEGGFEKFIKPLNKCAAMKDSITYKQFGFQQNNNLRNFLITIDQLQKHTKIVFHRYVYAFLTNYIENYQQISNFNMYQIIRFLTKRGYVSKSIAKHFNNYQFDNNEVKQIIAEGDSNQILAYFQKLSLILQSIISLQNYYKKIQNKKIKFDYQSIKAEVIKSFFEILDDRRCLHTVLRIWDPQLIFLNELFQTHKDRYFNIIKQITNPLIFCNLQMNENIYNVIFNKLFLYSSFEDKPYIFDLLDRYTKCLRCFDNDANDHKKIGTSLIILCDKFGYYSQNLYYFMTVNYAKIGLQIKATYLPVNAMKFHKNKINLRNVAILKCESIINLLKNINGKKSDLQPILLDNLYKRFDNLNDNKNQEFSVDYFLHQNMNLFFQKDKQEKQRAFNFYLQKDQLFLSEKNIKFFEDYYRKIQKNLQVKINYQMMTTNSYPLILRLFQGARLKAFAQCVYYVRFFIKNTSKNQQLFKIISQSKVFMDMVQKNIAYPGLLELIYMLYHSAKIDKLNAYNPNSELQKFIKTNQTILNGLYQKLINQTKSKGLKTIIKPQNCSGVQLLTNPIKINPNFYSDINNLQLPNYNIVEHLQKFEKLRNKITQQLKYLKDKSTQFFAFSIYVQFPFVADYFIIINKKSYVFIFVDADQRQKYQRLIKRGLDKKLQTMKKLPQQKLQNSENNENTQIITQTQLCIHHFQQNYTVILMSGEQDVMLVRTLVQKSR